MSEKKRSFWHNPAERLFGACALLLGAVIALQLALVMLAQIWVWLVLLAAIGGGIYLGIRTLMNRRERW